MIKKCKKSKCKRQARFIDLCFLHLSELGKFYCKICKIIKEKSSFHKDKSNPHGVSLTCKECSASQHRKRLYGVTENEYNNLKDVQNNLCAVCKQPQTKG